MDQLLQIPTPPTPEPPEIMTPEELAELIRIAEGTLSQWRSRRIGPRYFKVGRHVRYRRADVMAWFEAQAGPMPAAS